MDLAEDVKEVLHLSETSVSFMIHFASVITLLEAVQALLEVLLPLITLNSATINPLLFMPVVCHINPQPHHLLIQQLDKFHFMVEN